jgi:signal peptidase II
MRINLVFWGSAFIGLVLDQFTKWAVFKDLKEAGAVSIIPGFLNFLCSKNRGSVFGFAQGKNSALVLFSFIAIGVIIWIYIRSKKSLILGLSMGFILAGAVGNLWDRIFYSYVRDFIDIHLGTAFHWPTFNIADALICLGIGLMLLETFLLEGRE